MPERYYLQGPQGGLPKEFFPRAVLFDANIWLSISGPFEDHIPKRASAYSSFYKNAVESGSEIHIPQIVASEFLNRSVMILAKAAGFDRTMGKIHRAENYRLWIKEACDLLHAIIDGNVRVPDDFHEIKMEHCYKIAEGGGLEFHDVLIASLCDRNDFTLVTDDADYTGHTVPIVTWNQRLQ